MSWRPRERLLVTGRVVIDMGALGGERLAGGWSSLAAQLGLEGFIQRGTGSDQMGVWNLDT